MGKMSENKGQGPTHAREERRKKKYDWVEIETRYVAGHMTLEELAKQTGASMTAIGRHSCADNWAEKRVRHREKVKAKAAEKLVTKEARVADRILGAAERLAIRLEKYANDEDTLHGYVYQSGGIMRETQKKKADTKALRNLAGAMRDAAATIEQLTQLKEQGGGNDKRSVIIMPERLPDEDG